jgi:hypothetical protein
MSWLGMSLATLQLELAKEESTLLSSHDVSPSSFLQVGLDLEEQQYIMLAFEPHEVTNIFT